MFFGLLILISEISCQIYSLYEISPNITLSYSKGLSEIRNKILKNVSYSITNSTSDLIEVEKNVHLSILYYQNNIDFANGYPYIQYSLLENDILNLSLINIDYYHDSSVFYPLKINKNSAVQLNEINNNQTLVNCLFKTMHFENVYTKRQSAFNLYEKFQYFLQYTFGLYNNELYYFKINIEDNKKIERKDCQGNIKTFFIRNKNDNIYESYLYLYIPDETKICIYSLSLDSNYLLNYKYINKISDINSEPLDITNYYDYIYYSLKGVKKIIQTSFNDIKLINPNSYEGNLNDLLSIIILDYTIYVLEENVGLVLTDRYYPWKVISKYNFTNAVKMDLFINPFTGFKFLGLYLHNKDNKTSDFFIELLIVNETNLYLNKALLYPDSKKPSIDEVLTFDYYFSYIYDKTNEQIIMIKRGSLNTVNFTSFKINMNLFSNNDDNKIFPFYNGDQTIIGVLNKNDFYTINNIYNQSELTCDFEEKGMYNIIFYQKQDFCKSSYTNVNNTYFCRNYITYRFNVLEKKSHKNRNLIIICTIVLIPILIFIILLVRYRKKIKDGKMIVKARFDKKNRKYLYENVNDMNNKNNLKNQNIGELNENNTPLINNNNFGGINDNFINEILEKNKRKDKKKNKNEIKNSNTSNCEINNYIKEKQDVDKYKEKPDNLFDVKTIEVKKNKLAD